MRPPCRTLLRSPLSSWRQAQDVYPFPFAPADASILIDVYDLPTGSICDRFQLSALIFGVLLRGAERYFHRHVIFHDHPGVLDETDGATGILQPRFIGKV